MVPFTRVVHSLVSQWSPSWQILMTAILLALWNYASGKPCRLRLTQPLWQSRSLNIYLWVGWWGAHVYQLYTVNWAEITACSKRSPICLRYYRRHYKSLKTLLTHFEFLVLIPCLWASCETLLWFGHKLPLSHCWLDFGVEKMFLIGLELTISLTQVLVPSYLSQPDSSLAFRNDFFPERKCIS